MTAQWPHPSTVPVAHPDGGLIAPFSDPIKRFVGCYLDSTGARAWQFPFRTLRARTVRIAPEIDCVLMIVGSFLFLYQGIARFFGRLESGEALMDATAWGAQTIAGSQYFLKPDAWFYAEDSGWKPDRFDSPGAPTLYDFAYDERGYIYLAHGPYGLMILQYTGAPTFREVWRQPVDDDHPAPVKVELSGRILTVFPEGGPSARLDVDNPASPTPIAGSGPALVPNSLTAYGIIFAQPPVVRSGFGWAIVAGQELALAAQNLHFFDTVQREVPSGDYFAKALSPNFAAKFGYVAPSWCGFEDVALWKSGGTTYMVVAAYGLGWVFELRDVGAIEIPVTKPPVVPVVTPPQPPIEKPPETKNPTDPIPAHGPLTGTIKIDAPNLLAGTDIVFSIEPGPGWYLGDATVTWDFGDLVQSSEMRPVHRYKRGGMYPVSAWAVTLAGKVFMRTILTIEDVQAPPVPPDPRNDPGNWRYFFDDRNVAYSWANPPTKPAGTEAADGIAAADYYRHYAFDHIEYLTISPVDVVAHRWLAAVLRVFADRPALQHIGNWVLAGRPTK